MKILITWIGTWLDKGEAAMLISMVKDIRREISVDKVSVSASSFLLREIDILRYREYNLCVLPGLLVDFLSDLPKLSFLKFTILKAIAAGVLLGTLMIKYGVWLSIYKKFKFNSNFLIKNTYDIAGEYAASDAIILCGGQNIKNLSPGLFIALFEITFAKLLGKPVIIWANSLGPFHPRYIRPFVKMALNNVSLITTRESNSKNALEELGVTTPTFVTADAAFTLPAISQEEALSLINSELMASNIKIPKDSPLVGVTVIYWNFPGEQRNPEEKFENYLAAVASALDYLITKLDAYIFLFPQVIDPPGKDDRLISIKILDRIKTRSHVIILTKDYSPEQLKGMYGCMNLMLGTRFHSCIFAQSMNVPTIAIEYSGHKAFGIMKLLGLEEYVCNINTISNEELIFKINKIWAERDKVRETLCNNVKIMQNKSKENVKLAIQYLGTNERRMS